MNTKGHCIDDAIVYKFSDTFFMICVNAGMGSTIANHLLKNKDSLNKIRIKILPLDVFLKRVSVDIVDIMKIDIEGFEDKALFPFFKTLDKKLYPKLILMEDSSQTDWDKNILEWLLNNGYNVISRTRGNILIAL